VLGTLPVHRIVNRSRGVSAVDGSHPRGELGMDAAWAALDERRSALLEAVRAADGRAIGAIRFPHPVFGELNAYQWLVFVGAHEARHTAQVPRDRGVGARRVSRQSLHPFRSTRMRNAAAVCLIVLLSACATSGRAPESGITTKIITTTEVTQVEMRAGEHHEDRPDRDARDARRRSAIAIAPRAVALLATTDTLRLRAGEVVAFGSLR
jgi:hypothetical protein